MLHDTETLVCEDIKARQQLGIKKYGTTLANNNIGMRAWLEHAYQECLDQALYLKRAMQEIDQEKNEVYYNLAYVSRKWAELDVMDNNGDNG